jgi:hypothetical protein
LLGTQIEATAGIVSACLPSLQSFLFLIVPQKVSSWMGTVRGKSPGQGTKQSGRSNNGKGAWWTDTETNVDTTNQRSYDPTRDSIEDYREKSSIDEELGLEVTDETGEEGDTSDFSDEASHRHRPAVAATRKGGSKPNQSGSSRDPAAAAADQNDTFWIDSEAESISDKSSQGRQPSDESESDDYDRFVRNQEERDARRSGLRHPSRPSGEHHSRGTERVSADSARRYASSPVPPTAGDTGILRSDSFSYRVSVTSLHGRR